MVDLFGGGSFTFSHLSFVSSLCVNSPWSVFFAWGSRAPARQSSSEGIPSTFWSVDLKIPLLLRSPFPAVCLTLDVCIKAYFCSKRLHSQSERCCLVDGRTASMLADTGPEGNQTPNREQYQTTSNRKSRVSMINSAPPPTTSSLSSRTS
jgi:hypothetical protein